MLTVQEQEVSIPIPISCVADVIAMVNSHRMHGAVVSPPSQPPFGQSPAPRPHQETPPQNELAFCFENETGNF